jgi:prepilin-type N-terminal cleavage/methylation domain-containing protein
MKKGFTLIELLIVVVIIGILAAIAVPAFAATKSKAYTASMKTDLRNLVTAQEAYFSDVCVDDGFAVDVIPRLGRQHRHGSDRGRRGLERDDHEQLRAVDPERSYLRGVGWRCDVAAWWRCWRHPRGRAGLLVRESATEG